MIRDDAVSLIRGRCARYTGTDLDADIVLEMQAVQERLEGGNFWPWFMLSTEQNFSTTATVQTVTLPDNPRFMIEWEEGALWRYDSTNTESPYTVINKDDFDDLRALYPGSGEPKGYDIQGNEIWFAPTPDATYEYRWHYYTRDTVLSTNIENNWLLHASDLIIAETGKTIARHYLQNFELAAGFAEDATEAMQRLMVLDIARKEAQKRRIMGGITSAT